MHKADAVELTDLSTFEGSLTRREEQTWKTTPCPFFSVRKKTATITKSNTTCAGHADRANRAIIRTACAWTSGRGSGRRRASCSVPAELTWWRVNVAACAWRRYFSPSFRPSEYVVEYNQLSGHRVSGTLGYKARFTRFPHVAAQSWLENRYRHPWR